MGEFRPPEQPQEPDQPFDMEIAPAHPKTDELDRPGVHERLGRMLQDLAETTEATTAPTPEAPRATTPEERLAIQWGLFQSRIANLAEGLNPADRYSQKWLARELSRLLPALEQATPDQQEDILILENHDWRAHIAKHGEQDQERHIADLRKFRIHMLTLKAVYPESTASSVEDIPSELTPEEARLDYWRWFVSSFGMNAADIAEGIAEGVITGQEAAAVYREYALREARDRMNFEMIGPDTPEQGEISRRASEAFHETERRLNNQSETPPETA